MTTPRTTALIAGCFDGMHAGHLSMLRRAAALSDHLIVALNADSHLALKGPGRPIDTWEVRRDKILKTGYTTDVRKIIDTPLVLIMTIQPDVIAVGDDYTPETTVGYPQCLSWGGRVEILPRTPGVSTSQLIEDERRRQHVRDNLDIDPSQR